MTLTIELTAEQEEALRMIASAAGMEPGEYVKQTLVGEDPQLTEAEEIVLMAMLEDLKVTGQSINNSLATINENLEAMVATARGIR
jgi:hypothetical protein